MFRAIHFGADAAERRQTKERVLDLLTRGIVP